MKMECDGCKAAITKEIPVVNCDGCNNRYCKTCAKLAVAEIKVLSLKDRKLKFYCSSCQQYHTINLLQNIINSKDSLIEAKQRIIDLLEKELIEKQAEQGENIKTASKSTYASVVKSELPRDNYHKKNIPQLILSPKDEKQTCIKTKQDLQNSVNPSKIQVGIENIRNGRNGGIIIKCNSRTSNNKMISEIQKSLGNKYTVKETQLRKPTVTIANIDKDVREEEIIEAILNQNECLKENDDELELKLLKNTKKGDYKMAIIECKGSTFKKLITANKINIKYNRCPVYENISVLRCLKCNGFNHKMRDCKKETVCTNCAENHSAENCVNRVKKCISCENSNLRFKTDYDINHSCLDSECPVFKKQLSNVRDRTDYSN